MADSEELEQIRSKRMGELQAQNQSADDQKRRSEAIAKEEEMKNAILSQVLNQDARARLSNIAAANPQKAAKLESMIVNMARYGQIAGKLTDEQFKALLQRVSEQTQTGTTVKVINCC